MKHSLAVLMMFFTSAAFADDAKEILNAVAAETSGFRGCNPMGLGDGGICHNHILAIFTDETKFIVSAACSWSVLLG